jgi:hypothetical protein
VCGDGECTGDENCVLCAEDCGQCPPACGDGECNGEETCGSCSADCGDCPVCGDDSCNGEEGCGVCLADCGECEPSCGDGQCNGDETCGDCAEDCGACPSCGDDSCNGDESCDDCETDCGACPAQCGDGVCDGDEQCRNCPADCGACASTCGDGLCGENEGCDECEADCGSCPGYCGDGACFGAETCSRCARDCGACPWPPGPRDPDLTALPAELAGGTCAAIADCMIDPFEEIVFGQGDCVSRTTARFEDGDFIYVQASIDAGRIVFDADAVATCVADIAALSCDLPTARFPASCEDVLQGQVPTGGACSIDDDCAGRDYCASDASCPGTCTQAGGEGDACAADGHCASGLVCFGGSCSYARQEGESCGPGVGGCHLGLLCMGGDSAMGVPGTCLSQQDLIDAGEDEDCDPTTNSFCEAGLACVLDVIEVDGSPEAVAVCKPRAEPGGPCNLAFAPEQCPPGEYCPVELPEYQGTCVPRPVDGEACGVGDMCADDHYCDENGVCRSGRRIDQACPSGGACFSRTCDDGVCIAPVRCRLDPEPTCGDGLCEADEDCDTCAEDCGCAETCGDGRCGASESCVDCAVDCGACSDSCGDARCTGDEACDSCARDCGACSATCGDDSCDAEESCENCSADCGSCPPACGDGLCEGDESCDSCAADCGECPPACGDDRCNGDETCESCAADCGACPPECGDDACDAGESCESCAADCGTCPTTCGDDLCEGDETCESCAADCGSCPAPYSGPCEVDADCAPDQVCVTRTVSGGFGLFEQDYGYCAETCSQATDCSGVQRVTECTSEGHCARQCDAFVGLLDPAYLCDFGSACVEGHCTWARP